MKIHKRILLIGIGSSLFWISLYLYSPILPIHAKNLGSSLEMVGLIVSSYAFGQIILRIPIGIYADKFGRKPFVIFSLLLNAAGALWLGLSQDPWSLFTARTITGIAAAGWVAISVMYASFFDKKNSTKSMAQAMSINTLSVLGATFFGGIIADNISVKFTFFLSSIFSFIGAVIIFFVSEPDYGKINHSFKKSLNATKSKFLLLVSSVGITIQFVTFGVTFGFLTIFAENIGATKYIVGLITSFGLLSTFIFTAISPIFVKKLGNKITLQIASTLIILSLIITPFIESYYLIIPLQILGGAGRGLINTILISLVIQYTPEHLRGSTMGSYQAIYAIGMMAGPLISGVIASIYGIESVFFTGVGITLIGMAIISNFKLK